MEARDGIPRGAAFGPSAWDERFGAPEAPYGESPSLFLVDELPRLGMPGTAILPGDGGGRNGVWLAAQGWRATSLDYSPVALEVARTLAQRRGVSLRTEQADVTTWAWPRGACDLVAAVYLHLPSAVRPAAHRAMLDAVKPGGHVLIEAFAPEQMGFTSGGPRNPDMLYSEALLRDDFAAAEIVVLRKDFITLDEGPLHRGPAALIRLLARRKG